MNSDDKDKRTASIQGLRDLADWLESHPIVPIPASLSMLNGYVETKEQIQDVARSDSFEKEYAGIWFALVKRFGPVEYCINIQREKVCRKKVVGTQYKPAETVEVVEWECTESLLS